MNPEIKSVVYLPKKKKWKKTTYTLLPNGKLKKDKQIMSNRNPESIKEITP